MNTIVRKKGLVLLLVFLGILFTLHAESIDLNTATLRQIESLPITKAQAKAIYDYRTFTAFFETIYDLRKIAEIDQQTMLRIKPLVTITLFTDLDETEQRREEIYYLLERLGSQEGTQEGFTDIWEDYLMTPHNINKMHYSDILNIPNVTPLDAAAVRRRIEAEDTITDMRNLRSTTGLSNYGATNLRNYIYYKDTPSDKKWYMNYQFRYDYANYEDDVKDLLQENIKHYSDRGSGRDYRNSYWGYFDLEESKPAFSHKFRARYEQTYKLGFLYNSDTAQIDTFDKDLPDKFYFAYSPQLDFIGDSALNVYAGNFRVTYGEGLVIENTDYYNSRNTGYGFSKRIIGITEDLSRSQEYALRGVALEFKNPMLSVSGWYSSDKKDAVVYNMNGDSVIDAQDKLTIDGKYRVFSYITPTIRWDNDSMNEAEAFFNETLFAYSQHNMELGVRTDILEETMLGGRVEYSPFVGTHIGITTTELRYPNAHFYMPDASDMPILLVRDNAEKLANAIVADNTDNTDKWKKIDSQINNLYATETDKYRRDFRRVTGFDWRVVYDNTSFQGEYAELFVDGNTFKMGDDPKAMLFSTYSQFDNLYLMALYRNYDLDFDNPYNRGFSEHQKFDGTVLASNAYLLENQLLGDMYQNNAEPQAEEGIYFETRYRFTNKLTLNRTYLDIFERKADARRTVRFQGDLEYRPLYQLGVRGRYKHQVNRYDDFADRQVSETVEPSAIISVYLSDRDRVQIEYRYTQVKNPPYPYLTNNAEFPLPGAQGQENFALGQVLSHGDLVEVDWTKNINDRLRFRTSIAYWNGHGMSHWDWEDSEIDFMGEQGIKYWVLVQSKIANNLYLALKYRIKYYQDKELFFRTWENDLTPFDVADQYKLTYHRNVERVDNAVRLLMEWRF